MIKLYKVSGDSMQPALKNNQYIISEKLSYFFAKPKKNDIIIFKNSDNKNLVKRIKFEETAQYFVASDNRGFSGFIKKELILEKLLFKI